MNRDECSAAENTALPKKSRRARDRTQWKAILLLAGFLALPVGAFAGEGPGSLPAELPVSIHFRGSWNTDDGKAQIYEEGSCTVHAYGKMVKLGADSPFYAHYVPAGVVASFNYSETIIARPYDGKGPCKGVVARVSGSGTADVTEGVELGKGSLFLQAFSGPLGIGAAMQAAGDPSLAEVETLLERLENDPDNPVYAFSLSVPVSAVVKEKPGCETLHTGKLDFPIVLTGLARMGKTGLTGNFSWPAGEAPKTGASVQAVGSKVSYGPEPGKKEAGQATLRWGFGQVEPTVALFIVEKGERVEFTEEEADVLAGRKVRLQAEVFPYPDEGSKGKWSLPPSAIAGLEGYDRDNSRGGVRSLSEEDKAKRTAEFYCLDGSFGGKRFPVSYAATVKGKKVEGKAALKVFSPEGEVTVIPEKTVSIGKVAAGQPCSAYLGKVTSRVSIPGIEVKGKIRFPPGFDEEEKAHELAYVQLLKENILERKGRFGQDGGDYFRSHSGEYALDTRFPYGGTKGNKTLDMNDAPSDEIGPLTLEIHHFQDFRTTFLVRAGKDGEAVWLPLATIPWRWKFSLERAMDNPGWEETCAPGNFRLYGIGLVLPGPLERFGGKPEDVPRWNRVLDAATGAASYRDDSRWKKDVEEFSKIAK